MSDESENQATEEALPVYGEENDDANEEENYHQKVAKKTTKYAVVRGAIAAVFHPLHYSKVLMQLGNEPIPLQQGKRFILFGRQAYFLPNAFAYSRHIYQRDGFSGMYAGVTANVFSSITVAYADALFTAYLDKKYPNFGGSPDTLNASEFDLDDKMSFRRAVRQTARQCATKIVVITVSRPLQVVMIRQMAQFVGGEELYENFVGSFVRIFKDEGISGFFKGLVPMILGDVAIVCMVNGLMFLSQRAYVNFMGPTEEEKAAENAEETDQRREEFLGITQKISLMCSFLASSVFYPFHLVSTVCAVNGTSLKAGSEPMTPVFDCWSSCYSHLHSLGQGKRGAKMFLRAYDGPLTVRPLHDGSVGNFANLMAPIKKRF